MGLELPLGASCNLGKLFCEHFRVIGVERLHVQLLCCHFRHGFIQRAGKHRVQIPHHALLETCVLGHSCLHRLDPRAVLAEKVKVDVQGGTTLVLNAAVVAAYMSTDAGVVERRADLEKVPSHAGHHGVEKLLRSVWI